MQPGIPEEDRSIEDEMDPNANHQFDPDAKVNVLRMDLLFDDEDKPSQLEKELIVHKNRAMMGLKTNQKDLAMTNG